MSAEPRITLLGPQRKPNLDEVVRELGMTGPIATINAGWQDREVDDTLLDSMLSGRSRNLGLWRRMQEIWDNDPEFTQADRDRRRTMVEMQELYLRGLDHATRALADIRDHVPRREWVRDSALKHAERVVRDLDTRHIDQVTRVYADFWERTAPHERPAIARARAEVAQQLADVEAVVMTGGDIRVLLNSLHLFNITPILANKPIIAWGAGAMALTERVVLFNDRATHGPTLAEVYAEGLGLVKNAVALPSARDRLNMSEKTRMATIARRFAPAQCLLLDAGAHVSVCDQGLIPAGSPILGADGAPTTSESLAAA
ncbi:Type 1 glutamine amidotransferase-like domain-containing protein [Ornithinimicrobium sp. Arc0846-15]|nr:Type 1 glutamine amidotransferase-like domain-containing protein [Ornithinimicrobium laminariae]